MDRPLRVLVAGCGNMGASHARAYHRMPEFEIVGLVSRGPASRHALGVELGGLPEFADYEEALARHETRRGEHQHLSGDPRALRPRGDRGGLPTSSARSPWPRPSRKPRPSSTRPARAAGSS